MFSQEENYEEKEEIQKYYQVISSVLSVFIAITWSYEKNEGRIWKIIAKGKNPKPATSRYNQNDSYF